MTPSGSKPRSKERWDQLAIFGGAPAFPEPLHVGRPSLPDRSRFDQMIDQIWVTGVLSNNGPFVQQLEERFCELTGADHAVAVSNATLGLQLVARALDLEGEIILPSFTFIATPHAFRWEGLRPVFCDVDERTHTLDPVRVEELVGEETCAIAGVHLWANVCATEELKRIARENALHLVYDAAHALGVESVAGKVGSFGEAEVFSLHATKIANGFEGGVITTNSDVLAHQLRNLRNFGFAGYDDVRGLGTNAKMSEVSAAMALCSLEQLGESIAHNRHNLEQYRYGLTELGGIRLVEPADPQSTNAQYVVLRVEAGEAGLTRDDLAAALWAEGIRARRYFHPGCHRADPYRWECADAGTRLPVTQRLCQEVLVLPTGPSIAESEVEAICGILRTCRDAARRIAERERPAQAAA